MHITMVLPNGQQARVACCRHPIPESMPHAAATCEASLLSMCGISRMSCLAVGVGTRRASGTARMLRSSARDGRASQAALCPGQWRATSRHLHALPRRRRPRRRRPCRRHRWHRHRRRIHRRTLTLRPRCHPRRRPPHRRPRRRRPSGMPLQTASALGFPSELRLRRKNDFKLSNY